MQRTNYRTVTGILVAAAALAACSGGSSNRGDTASNGEPTGTLSVALVDSPVTDVSQIWITIKTLRLKPAEGSVIEFPMGPDGLKVDLLTLTPANSATLLDSATVPAGQYDWMELVLDADFDGSTEDSSVVTNAGGEEELAVELRVPSGSVRLVSGFTVTADQETSFMIDWDARHGLVAPPGQPGYMLRPAFRIVDMTEYGTLSGTVLATVITDSANGCDVDDPDLDVGNAVYIFAGSGVLAEDIDGDDTDADPIHRAVTPQEAVEKAFSLVKPS